MQIKTGVSGINENLKIMLKEVLDEAGYMYDSTFSANDVLTAFPFRALKLRKPTPEE